MQTTETKTHPFCDYHTVCELVSKKTKIYNLQTIFKYGKYEGLSIEEVILVDYKYIIWRMLHIEKFYVFDSVAEQIKARLPKAVFPFSKVVTEQDYDQRRHEILDSENNRNEYSAADAEADFRFAFGLDSDWAGDESDYMDCNGY